MEKLTSFCRPLLRSVLFPSARFIFPSRLRDFCLRLTCIAKASRWVKDHPSPYYCRDRFEYFSQIMESEGLNAPIDYLEFGVYQGASLRYWVDKVTHPDARFVGFDSFEGLPEHWGGSHPSGTFSTEGNVPIIDDKRCSFEVGLFHDTLPAFLRKWDFNRRTVVHMDADLFSSSLYLLMMLGPRLKPGDVLLFDDFLSIRHAAHEFRAFDSFSTAYPISFEVLGTTGARIAMKIVDV